MRCSTPSGSSSSGACTGVDRNELAAELGKLSLWLATLARDHEFSFLDHCIRHGDSLVGLDRRQIEALTWASQSSEARFDLLPILVRDRLAEVEHERERIRTALENAREEQQRLVLARAQQALADPKLVGDAVIAAFFSADRARARVEGRLRLRGVIEQAGTGWQERLKPDVTALRAGASPVVPFHWPLEFPEVFDRDNPGFDAIVGNPPFAGKNTTIAVNAEHYLDWLQTLHEGAHGNSDIVAHFFRRAYGLLRDGGCLGLLATNTIRQGDTRATGLTPICHAGGDIYCARKRLKWPGEAAVVVSVVHISKGPAPGLFFLNARPVSVITAYLFHGGGHDSPHRLLANQENSFIGHYVNGAGFTFDDSNPDASSLDNMRRLINRNPRNEERIFPYLGGEEILNHPRHLPHRYVINFGDMTEDQARAWPELMNIIEEKVKPHRINQSDKASREQWWLFARRGGALEQACQNLRRVLVHPNLSNHLAFAFVPRNIVVGAPHNIFAFEKYQHFLVLQSRVHEVWARFFASSMKDDLRYTPSDCFETFPFPDVDIAPELELGGEEYYNFRASLMIDRDEGLTKIYNRFHYPEERLNAVGELRRLHDAMDRAVLDAYGWTDIRSTCEFELEWEDDEAENGRRRRKPWRYRWPEPIRDEVLARLLALNAQRAQEERLTLGDRQRRF